MTSRRKPADVGAERGRVLLDAVIRDLVIARRDRGLSLAEVGKAVGITGSMASRIEGRRTQDLGIIRLATMLAVVGLDLSARAFPGGSPVRDSAHAALLARFGARLHASLRWSLEVPLPIPGDLRAWDGMVRGPGWGYGVEAETHPTDGQALIRRLELKVRDSGTSGVILLLPRSQHARSFRAAAAGILDVAFPVDGSRAMKSLTSGVDPGGDTIIVL